MGEKIIYSPGGEGPKEKQAAKDYEKKHLERRGFTPSIEDDPQKFKESKSQNVSDEELKKLLKTAEKMKEGSVGISKREMKEWWLGKNEGKGAKDLAEAVFNYFFTKINLSERINYAQLEQRKKSAKDFIIPDEIDPILKPFLRGVIEHGAQEDILLYLMDEWRPAVIPEVREKIWQIFQDYSKELIKKEDVFENSPDDKNGEKKEIPHSEPDHRLDRISKEEARQWVEDIERVMKERMGGRKFGDFKKWWLGEKSEGAGDGAKELANWIFTQISYSEIFEQFEEKEDQIKARKENFAKNIEPALKRLIEETIEHGAQEDIWRYFWDEWALNYTSRIAEKVWEFYKNYFEKTAKKI